MIVYASGRPLVGQRTRSGADTHTARVRARKAGRTHLLLVLQGFSDKD